VYDPVPEVSNDESDIISGRLVFGRGLCRRRRRSQHGNRGRDRGGCRRRARKRRFELTTGSGGSVDVVPGDSLCGAVQLTETRTIAAGSTVTVCAGTTVTMAASASISVAGTLLIQGTAADPVKFMGTQASAGFWPGVVLKSGGSLTGTYLEIHAAQVGISAEAGSSYQIDQLLIDTASEGLSLSSSGTISHGTLHGLGDNQAGPAIEVNSASPQISDTVVNQGAYGAVDIIIVSGAKSAPVFDHVEVADSHCAFHANEATGLVISNSFIHHNAYGIMAIDTNGTIISHSNFEDNSVNVGSCDATATGQLSEDYFQGMPTDSSCGKLRSTNGVLTPYKTDVGPRP
jgi:hypothetical protein